MHFFSIFLPKNLVDWKNYTIFAPDFGKRINRKVLKRQTMEASMSTKTPKKRSEISYNLAVRMKFAAKIQKVNEFTKFFDNKITKITTIMAKVFNSKECQREFNLYRKKVARLNAYIEDVIKKVGNNEVYLDKSSTIVSAPASVWPIYECPPDPGKEFCEFNGIPSLEFRQRYQWPEYSKDGITRKEECAVIRIVWTYDLEADEWYAEYHGDSFDFESDLRYTKKCVRNGLRFWQSEDPDRFLEKDDDEEGGEV